MEEEEIKSIANNRLPFELESNIVSRLPLQDLLRFRHVSKTWRDEVRSPNFNKSYIHQQHLKKNLSNSIIVWGNEMTNGGKCFHLFFYDFLCHENVKKLTRSRLQALSDKCSFDLVGSSNGLLCLRKKDIISRRDFLLYNPVFYEFKLITHTVRHQTSFDMVGFGYDCMSDDYKIIDILHESHANYDHKIEFCVYSLKNKSSRIVKPYPDVYAKSFTRTGIVFSNNAMHWLSGKPREPWPTSVIISGFGIATEEYYDIPHPDRDYTFWEDKSVADLRECLHLVIVDFHQKCDMEIWIMKEYRVKESWTKLIHISLQGVTEGIIHYGFWNLPGKIVRLTPALPYAYSEDRREILVGFGNPVRIFLRLDLHCQKFTELESCVLPYDMANGQYRAIKWVGSLISPLKL